MPPIIHLPPRRYTVLDSIAIAFRCTPIAAFFYGFFDLAWAALTPVTTLVAARLIDAVVSTVRDGAPVAEVYRYLALLAGFTAFGWLRSALHNLADLRLTLALRARYRTALTAKRTRLEYALLEQSETWDLIQRVAANPEGGRLKATYYHLVDLAAFVFKVVGLLALLASAVWWAPLVVFAVGGFALVIGVVGGKALYQAERLVAEHDRRLDYLSGVLLGREAAAERTLFGSSGMVTGMWRKSFRSALNVRLSARLRWYVNSYAGNLTNQLIWVLLMLALLPSLQNGAVSIGLFIALTQAFTRFDIVWGFMDTVNGIAADAEFFKDLTDFLALPEESIVPTSTPIVPPTAPAQIELRDVRFRYPGTQRYVLDGLSLTLEAGKRYALVGANGCGKTTITRLLTGLYPAESGFISVNGRGLQEVTDAELRSLISVVYQDFARYSVSLRDNVFLGQESAEDKLVFERAGLSPLVARLPRGVDTPLGKIAEDGVDISGGEWQRVAMARSLARPAALRILDEPTAALDPVAESELYASFERLTEGATTLLITHRLGATKTADVILVLDGGRIVEAGSHTELMQSGGLYAHMYESQRHWYEAE
ncbi:MAG: ABC transporter ATP-binding protein/permease [Anaerolineales bacterium]|jgi:ATP-binding cassette subfamily B protein|nr:ABC transporter ATP-binding protein/permease [Anaerolineales bacterium]